MLKHRVGQVRVVMSMTIMRMVNLIGNSTNDRVLMSMMVMMVMT